MAKTVGETNTTPDYARRISAEEQKIVDFIDAHIEDAAALLEKTVNIESPTENLAGVREVGMVFKQEFESLGFDTKWIEMPFEMKRAGHLIAPGNQQKFQARHFSRSGCSFALYRLHAAKFSQSSV